MGSGETRKHKTSGFTSWLKKSGSAAESADAKKLASPAEEIKMVFLRQLELGSVDLNGKHYHSVFTGAQIVDIILKHFGLPDRKLATNVASRLIDCRLYTHVSGPSLDAQSAADGTSPSSKVGVVDSNAEIYTLTTEALSALKTLKSDSLQRTKTQTRKRYMDIRGHLSPRPAESRNSSSRTSTSTDASSGSYPVGGSENSLRSNEVVSRDTDTSISRNSHYLASSERSPHVPPPLDVTSARRSGAAASHQTGYSPTTPLTGDNNDSGGQAARLQEVDIPTGDLGVLLKSWSFVGDGSLAFTAETSQHSSTADVNADPNSHRADASIVTPARSTQESPSDCSPDEAGAENMRPLEELDELEEDECCDGFAHKEKSIPVLTPVRRRRRWAMYREYSDGQLDSRRRKLRDRRTIRSYASAPSLSSIAENGHSSRHGNMHRPSLPLPRDIFQLQLQLQSRPQSETRDEWVTGDDEDDDGLMGFMAQRNSRYSDITVSSSYVGVRPFNGTLLERSFIFSEESGDGWPARSSTGSQIAEIQSNVAETEADTDGTSIYSTPNGMFVIDEDGKRQRALSDPAGLPRLPRTVDAACNENTFERSISGPVYQGNTTFSSDNNAKRSLQNSRLRRKFVTPDPHTTVVECASEETSGRASSVTLGSSMRHSESAVSEDGAMQLQLWRDTVPVSLLQSLSPDAIARQEAIYELVATELAYLRDLELIDAVFGQPLLSAPHIMPREQAQEFLRNLFYNYNELIANSRALYARLRERQSAAAVVSGVGDIFDEWADSLEAFVEYAVHVPAAQCALESQLLNNRAMADFLATAESAPGARRLPVQSFLGRAATRLARYPLLLDAIHRRTLVSSEGDMLQSASKKVRHALAEIDRRTGENAAELRMRQINQRLRLVPGARESLALDSPARRLIKEGLFTSGDGVQVLVFLFDNALVMAVEEKVPYAKNVTRYIADARIIPVSMLDVSVPVSDSSALTGIREALGLLGPSQSTAPRNALLRHSSSAASVKPTRANSPLSFIHIGCRALCRTLLATSDSERDSWLTVVRRHICVPQTLVEAYTELRLLSDRDFPQARGPQCTAPFTAVSGCRMLLFGNRDGLHLGIYGVPTSVVRISHCGSVSKIHVLRRYNIAIVLSDQTLLVFPLTAIENATANIGSAGLAGTKIASSVAFFDVGMYLGLPLIVLMKPRNGKSHFKCIQPQFINADGTTTTGSDYSYDSSESTSEYKRSAPPPSIAASAADSVRTLRTVYQGARCALNLISEFSIPGKTKRVHFLRRKLCIVASKTFEIVDVANSRLLRSLPDPLDDDFSFVQNSDSGHAMAICKIGREFLLCYESFAFYIDNFGRRSRPDVFIRWEMAPHMITFRHPYIVAINPKFLEVRHMESGVLLSIIRIPNAVCLNPDSKSTTLHIGVGPQAVGTATTILDNATAFISNDGRLSDSADAVSAIPAPVVLPTSRDDVSPRPASTVVKSATVLGCPNVTMGHVVPGIAGKSGKRLFPEGSASYYRVVEIRMPPLKSSQQQQQQQQQPLASVKTPPITSTSKPVQMTAASANSTATASPASKM
ncbi:RHO1 GDP-GTP exchange protein 2 [Coemansia interrupta]|uniref:RHO1 GDP-GTP exchange protein 2 n=1 Tax=Coemansia interrupta TaxID=1126814 RepID=A0A9W8HM68_9FUNG|nr:RHO1 GDP-GTP exchange protein 2 [Coemansia interrupta]